MGIPHLIALLEQHSTKESLARQSVVIDGPAFAYFIYFRCLASRSSTEKPFEATPTYAELGESAIQWLDGLREDDVNMYALQLLAQLCRIEGALADFYSKTIYFDGFLPPAKLDTRLARLISTTRRMSDFYYANQTVEIPTSHNRAQRRFDSPSSTRPGISALPPPPFHVPAIIEALQESSQYRNITHVVPGEADVYCSKYLIQNGGVVLTGDSDLLVHPLGPEGKVCFFKDIKKVESKRVRGRTFQPSSIAKKLELPASHGLVSLAFEMIMDVHKPRVQHISEAKDLKAIQAHPELYEEFEKEYTALAKELPSGSSLGSAASLLQSLDPRISEFVLHFPSLAELAGQEMGPQPPSATHIFLPFLIDTPEHTSTWEMTTPVRQLAYGLMNLIVCEDQRKTSVNEHKKQKDESQGRELLLPSLSEVPEACAAIVRTLAQLRERFPGVSSQELWTVVAIYHDIDWANAHSKKPLSTFARQQVLGGDSSKTSAWDVIQFHSQTQASYYSFRTLKQILALAIAHSANTLPDPIKQLHKQVADLPKFAQLQSLHQITSTIQLVTVASPIIHDILGIEYRIMPSVLQGDKKAAKRKRKLDREIASSSRPKTNNPFELLDIE